MQQPVVHAFFEPQSFTYSYLVWDPLSKEAAVIDPVLEFDAASGSTSTSFAQRIITKVKAHNLTVQWLLETHVHADHLSAAPFLKQQLGGRIAIGSRITEVQQLFGQVFNLNDLKTDGSAFDKLFADGEDFMLGTLNCSVIHTPGHTPACVSYCIGDTVFVGDTLFMPDYGSARCDFPGGDAATLYHSVQKLYQLPDQTRMFLCHDYKAPGREEFVCETTVAAQKQKNIHLKQGVSVQSFVSMRTSRDKTLGMPKLILPSVQVNVRAGQFPAAEDNGTVYLKLPVNLF
ncbi:MBL fold metallo-hydrolase [Rheinheimera soli]|jgi:glyoxylase-like metal-dependent hydrolase (beta-lactamase superfamily II)|uniref:Glyoxylase-like metal-dependent hydrolase (Beta-lactamase superfamily II) n=1 Tax=Rheinheimera soli TaxID=443616 RepID=A0ABU1VVZ7_9GAMM|nr:MBL fold metallo-hydrolase [Rheinheimera soli]MDR7119867.1 glyoxylase-like metal-dependent hydrolase (beta-lactamase superfamily II) [Rheinheimera soli]